MIEPYYSDRRVTLYLGDCREVLPELQGGVSVDCVIADPPYGETALDWDVWPTGWVAAARAMLKPAASLWCFGRPRVYLSHLDEFAGLSFSQEVIWEKHNGSGFADGRFARVHENVWQWYVGAWGSVTHDTPRERIYTGDKSTRRAAGATLHRRPDQGYNYVDDGLRLVRSVMRFPSVRGKRRNETEKPVGLVGNLVESSVPPDGIVLDPTAGAGTTLAAAQMLGRRAIGIEIREDQCEKAALRLDQGVLDFTDVTL